MFNEFENYVNNSVWIIGALSVTLLYLAYWYRRPRRLPPGPRGFPVVGDLPYMGKYPEKVAYDLSKKYGKILTIRMGAEDAVFLNDYDSIHQVSNLV